MNIILLSAGLPVAALAVVSCLVFWPSPGRHSAPTPVLHRIIAFHPESMQLEDDAGWTDEVRDLLEAQDADDLWAEVVPLHRERELSRAA